MQMTGSQNRKNKEGKKKEEEESGNNWVRAVFPF